MTLIERYSRRIGEHIAQVDYPAAPHNLYDPIRYTMEDGGKRLRPLFTLMACGLWRDEVADKSTKPADGSTDETSNKVTEALPAAAAIELFHNFTLLHDDIMDNAPLRRGRPTVHAKWGENVAILSGDSMTVYAYRELARTAATHLPAVLGYFNEAAVKVCEGQQLDMDFEGRDDVSVADHLTMIELKTAALFVGAVSMGAVVGGASSADVALLREFALQFGVAFQMQDDLLDSYGDARLGKTVGGDILEGKKTFLKMTAMEAASSDDRAALEMTHKDLRYSPEEKIARVLALYDRYGVRAAVEEEISCRFALAALALDALSAPRQRVDEFKAFALSLLNRTK
ncbi:MAG: polyprenyl synthetase family protein [Alistipes sp.]|nr:polyprenyl synthetase family protein [Alistipes sp.]